MGSWWCITGLLLFILILLCSKIYSLQKAAREISQGISRSLSADTNALLTISSRDRYMRRLAAELNVQLRALRQEKLRCRQGSLEVMDAVTNLSHDLRTPLTAIRGYLDLLREPQSPEDAGRYLAIIEERTQALCELTEELFSYWTGVSSLAETAYENVTLNGALEDALSAGYAALKNAGITPVVSMPEERIHRWLNKNALSRIFGNIISNAVKYSSGDLRITLETDGSILFSNHAPCLDELQVLRLLDRFYTVETAARSTGIGLSIARELTEQMKGTITACYQEGVLTISLLFP